MKAKIIITDDKGNVLQGEVELRQVAESEKQIAQKKPKVAKWYKKGSTTEKIVSLINQGFFKKPRQLENIVEELKIKDYHFKSSDLTLPLRRIVRKDLLKRTKNLPNGKKSKIWLYVEP